MPDPDGTIQNRDLADKIITDRVLDDDLTTATFTATTRFTGPYETNNAAADTERILLQTGRIRGYTGDSEETSSSIIKTAVNGSGDSRTLQMTFWTPSFLDDDGASFFTAHSASFDDSTTPPGWSFGDSSVSTQRAHIFVKDDIVMDLTAGRLELPTGTSDPSDPVDGLTFLDTTANEIRCYEGGAWRTIASW